MMKKIRYKPKPAPVVDMKAVLARIPALRGKLAEAGANLNKTLVNAENTLAGLHLGVRASVGLGVDEEGRQRVLSYVKDGKVWLLMVERSAQGRHPSDAEPLTSAPLSVRMHAIQHFPALLDALLKKAAAESAKVTTKTEALHAFIRNTQRLGDPDERMRKIDKVAHELFGLLEENGLDMDKSDDMALITNTLARHFFNP